MFAFKSFERRLLGLAAVAGLAGGISAAQAGDDRGSDVRVYGRTAQVDGLNIYYREAGADRHDEGEPTIVLLHGFPTSSHMFRNLIPELAQEYRVIAPDYPGYGLSDAPGVTEFTYTFDNLSVVVEKLINQLGVEDFVLYVQDYGAPVGYRIATRNPERTAGLIVQNGNAYVEGLPDSFWGPIKEDWKARSDQTRDALRGLLTPEATKWQYTAGFREPDAIDPSTYTIDQALMERPGNKDIQLALFRDYGSNPPLYPQWQQFFRDHQPPTIITWGSQDPIFPTSGALPYLRDLPHAELHLLDTGHFALEEEGDLIADLLVRWLDRHFGE